MAFDHRAAIERILADPGNDLVVAERSGRIVGTLQLTLIPGLARRGGLRLLVEALRVSGADSKPPNQLESPETPGRSRPRWSRWLGPLRRPRWARGRMQRRAPRG